MIRAVAGEREFYGLIERSYFSLSVLGKGDEKWREKGEVKGAGLGSDWTGKTVLVNGASGGVGMLVCQLARARGAKVVAICSAGNEEWVKGEVGVDEVSLASRRLKASRLKVVGIPKKNEC